MRAVLCGKALIVAALFIQSCSLADEQVTIFTGSALIESDSGLAGTSRADLSEVVGIVIYDKEIDGIFDDTVVFYGDESGEFTGMLRYEFPVSISARWLRKHVNLLLPALGVDTFLTVDVYSADYQDPGAINEWEPLIIRPDVQGTEE
jgi:hypothetical protein